MYIHTECTSTHLKTVWKWLAPRFMDLLVTNSWLPFHLFFFNGSICLNTCTCTYLSGHTQLHPACGFFPYLLFSFHSSDKIFSLTTLYSGSPNSFSSRPGILDFPFFAVFNFRKKDSLGRVSSPPLSGQPWNLYLIRCLILHHLPGDVWPQWTDYPKNLVRLG